MNRLVVGSVLRWYNLELDDEWIVIRIDECVGDTGNVTSYIVRNQSSGQRCTVPEYKIRFPGEADEAHKWWWVLIYDKAESLNLSE